jgi:hypothetical protein
MTGQIKNRYIVAARPGHVPEKKRPVQPHDGALDMLHELRR